MAKRSRKKRTPISSGIKPTRDSEVERTFFFDRWNLLRFLLIISVGWWVFSPALHGGWIWDDVVYIPHNPLSNDPARLWKIWFQPGSFIEYYPIEETVQWAQTACFHAHTLGYHVTNVVLHLISALLVWKLLSKFGLRLAWLGGLLFAIHPAVVESVAWMSELKNTLSLPPFLLAMCFYLDYDERGRRRDYLWALGLFFVAMLCKISMAPFPLVILLHAWWKRGRISRSDLLASVPFFIISLVLGILTICAGVWFRPTHHMPPDHVEVGGLLARLDLSGLLIAWYFYQIICPVTHSFFYPKWTVNPPSLTHLLVWPLVLCTLFLFWTNRRTWGRTALFGVGFFLVNLAPFLGLTLPSYMGFTWAMDHFLYLPMIGLIGLAMAALESIDQKLSAPAHLAGATLVTLTMVWFAFTSHRYAGTFADEITLWSHTVQVAPGSATAHEDLGTALMAQGHFPEAIAQFQLAGQITPLNSDIHNELGQALAQTGRLPEAMAEFSTAIKVGPDNASAYANRGHLAQITGDSHQALADLSHAIQLNPDLPEPYLNRSMTRQIDGDSSGALADLRNYCRIAPHSLNADYAHFGIWLLQVQQGQRTEADTQLATALNQSWNAAPGSWTTQIGHFLLGHISEEQLLAAATAANPGQDRDQKNEAWYYAGMVRLLSGDKASAVVCFRKCLALGETQSLAYLLAQGQLNLLQPH